MLARYHLNAIMDAPQNLVVDGERVEVMRALALV